MNDVCYHSSFPPSRDNLKGSHCTTKREIFFWETSHMCLQNASPAPAPLMVKRLSATDLSKHLHHFHLVVLAVHVLRQRLSVRARSRRRGRKRVRDLQRQRNVGAKVPEIKDVRRSGYRTVPYRLPCPAA